MKRSLALTLTLTPSKLVPVDCYEWRSSLNWVATGGAVSITLPPRVVSGWTSLHGLCRRDRIVSHSFCAQILREVAVFASVRQVDGALSPRRVILTSVVVGIVLSVTLSWLCSKFATDPQTSPPTWPRGCALRARFFRLENSSNASSPISIAFYFFFWPQSIRLAVQVHELTTFRPPSETEVQHPLSRCAKRQCPVHCVSP